MSGSFDHVVLCVHSQTHMSACDGGRLRVRFTPTAPTAGAVEVEISRCDAWPVTS